MLLGVNIDHVATLRNARGGKNPDVLRAAILAEEAGADIITMHLREDRRHIKDEDVFMVKEVVSIPLNFEMAATDEMVEIALKLQPKYCCIVPEKRQELTTEGGLNLSKDRATTLSDKIAQLRKNNICVTLFVEPDINTIIKANELSADGVEIHTGKYADLFSAGNNYKDELNRIIAACTFCQELNLKCNIGHGLDLDNIRNLLAIPNIAEVHIGHHIIGEAIFQGLHNVVNNFKMLINSRSR